MPSIPASDVWTLIREQVAQDAAREAVLAPFLREVVLDRDGLDDSLALLLARKLSGVVTAPALREVAAAAMAADPAITAAAAADLRAVVARDPACRGLATPLLWFKGFHAIQAHRLAHHLWRDGRHALALHLQNRVSEVFGADIHPAARIGSGILLDHGTGLVVGETAVVEDDVSILHEVTLGGSGKETGDRHPKIRRGVMIGAGAKILGNIVVGEGAKVGAGSVVLHDVPPHQTVAGVPARPVGRPACALPALEMDQSFEGEDSAKG